MQSKRVAALTLLGMTALIAAVVAAPLTINRPRTPMGTGLTPTPQYGQSVNAIVSPQFGDCKLPG